jgi:hypothetical protein
VTNPERADGCTLLDAIWNAEPFAGHAAFVADVRRSPPASCGRGCSPAPHSSYPPIVLRVDVAADAPGALVHQPTLLGHGEAWSAEASETITVRAP